MQHLVAPSPAHRSCWINIVNWINIKKCFAFYQVPYSYDRAEHHDKPGRLLGSGSISGMVARKWQLWLWTLQSEENRGCAEWNPYTQHILATDRVWFYPATFPECHDWWIGSSLCQWPTWEQLGKEGQLGSWGVGYQTVELVRSIHEWWPWAVTSLALYRPSCQWLPSWSESISVGTSQHLD